MPPRRKPTTGRKRRNEANATDRIAEEFNRLVALGPDVVATRSRAEQIIFYVVATRCEIDINGFASVYEQLLAQLSHFP